MSGGDSYIDYGFHDCCPVHNLACFEGNEYLQIIDDSIADVTDPHRYSVRLSCRIEMHLPLAGRSTLPPGYSSKAATGMVGLQNLGATCYLNALLQLLFHINEFRRAVYHIPLSPAALTLPASTATASTSGDAEQETTTAAATAAATPDEPPSTCFALQSVFHKLQFGTVAAQTSGLCRAFGWNSLEAFEQQDVQEMLRVGY
jgi:hypothetical protein